MFAPPGTSRIFLVVIPADAHKLIMAEKKKSKPASKVAPAGKTSARASTAKTSSKREAARGLKVRATITAIDEIMRTTPAMEWDDSAIGASSASGAELSASSAADRKKMKRKTHMGADKGTSSGLSTGSGLEVVDSPDFFPRLTANWLGVDLNYKDVAQPTLGPPAIELLDQSGNISLRLRKGFSEFVKLGEYGGTAGLWVGTSDELPGRVVIRAGNNEGRILLDSADSSVSLRAADGSVRGRFFPTAEGAALQLFDFSGKPFAYLGNFDGYGGLALGGADRFPGRIALFKGNLGEQIVLDAETGDIVLNNADCAEEFDMSEPAAEAGTVLVLDDEPGRLRPSDEPYDTRVAGVISGAGEYRPGIVLDRKGSREGRRPVALMGKVFCRVDANAFPVRPGTLLTTSGTPGHAMAATDRDRAFGAVLGKALAGLESGCGLVPVLVALQ